MLAGYDTTGSINKLDIEVVTLEAVLLLIK